MFQLTVIHAILNAINNPAAGEEVHENAINLAFCLPEHERNACLMTALFVRDSAGYQCIGEVNV